MTFKDKQLIASFFSSTLVVAFLSGIIFILQDRSNLTQVLGIFTQRP